MAACCAVLFLEEVTIGFFSGISGLLGGSSGGSKGSSQSGFALLPPELQAPYKQYGNQLNALFSTPQAAAFTPTPINAGERSALNAMYGGFTPDANRLQSDISMLTNPFDEYVINGINREAQGQNSLVNQFATQAGQQGSNRSFLGSSDVEQQRLNNIGQFRQSQYNNAVNASLGALSNSRRLDAYGGLEAGGFERGIDMQTRQAPFSALQSYGGMLGAIPQSGGSTQTSSSSNGDGGLGGILKSAASIASFFSDENLKENIVSRGTENGHNVYEFNYKDAPDKKYIGVLAQEVQKTHPSAVKEIEGYLAVDYGKIGVKFREVE